MVAPWGRTLHTVAFTDRGRTSTTTTLILSTANDDDATDETVAVAIPSSSSGDGVILVPIGFKDGATGHRKGDGQISITDDDTAGITVNTTHSGGGPHAYGQQPECSADSGGAWPGVGARHHQPWGDHW